MEIQELKLIIEALNKKYVGVYMGQINYDELLKYSVKLVEDNLKTVFSKLEEEASSVSPLTYDIIEIASDYTLRGGKRLRAFLALVGYWSREWGSGDLATITNVMTGIELLQSYLLIHDDIMDRDELRRGGPTVHAWFRDKCLKEMKGDCVHYGDSQAITVGDYLEATAVEYISRANLPGETLRRLLETYSRGLRMVAYGQYLDVLFSNKPLGNVSERDVLLVHTLKTASYTIELPLHLGVIASGKYSEKILRELTSYAIPAGIAFQLRDDIIGLYGDPRQTGKPVGSDVRGKKKTLLVVKAYELGDHEVKRRLSEIYDVLGINEVTQEHVKYVQEIVRETGSLEYNEELIKRHVENALKALEESKEISAQAVNILKWLLEKLAYREK